MNRVMRFLGASLVVPVAMLATAASASAHNPTGAFADFAQCPTENPAVEVCVYASSTGEFIFGGRTDSDHIPIVKPEIFQGGYYTNHETGKETFVGAANGETLVKVAQLVPAGLLANVRAGRYPWYFRNFCAHFRENSECRLTATAEVVGEPILNTTDLLTEKGIALEVPIVFHLKNPFLGNACYLGSKTDPMVIRFTTGLTEPLPPNMPVHGKGGSLEILEQGLLAHITGTRLIDNTFGIPSVTGCGGPQAIVVDKEFDEINELPLPPGYSSLEFNGELSTGAAFAVAGSEA
jgi:hypothetical protein